MAATHWGAIGPRAERPRMANPPLIPTTRPIAIWIRVSMARAMKRLPIPATAKSSAVCSGVSMVSLSTNEPRESWGSGKSEDMITIRWLEKRRPYWARLEQLVQQSNSGIAALSHNELKELGLLYRQIASDLAAVRQDGGRRQLAVYLNQLPGGRPDL